MRFLLIFALVVPIKISTGCVSKKVIKPTDKDLLNLTYDKFDQTSGEGWRALGEGLEDYLGAAKLIDQYVVSNANLLDARQIRILNWHAGQMYAFAGDVNLARQRFIESIDPNEPKDNPILWNDYVLATIAFLDKDLGELKKHKKVISEGPVFNGRHANLDVVDGLIKCFDRTYKEAYSQCR